LHRRYRYTLRELDALALALFRGQPYVVGFDSRVDQSHAGALSGEIGGLRVPAPSCRCAFRDLKLALGIFEGRQRKQTDKGIGFGLAHGSAGGLKGGVGCPLGHAARGSHGDS
jgi:hypothetical protein